MTTEDTDDWKSSPGRCPACRQGKPAEPAVRYRTARHIRRPDWEVTALTCVRCGHAWSAVRLGPVRREEEARLHVGLCHRYAHQYRRWLGFKNRSEAADELFAVAYAGLADGLSRYDPARVNPQTGREYKVFTYCGHWVIRALKTHARNFLRRSQADRRRRVDLTAWAFRDPFGRDSADALEVFAQRMADEGRVVAGGGAGDRSAVCWDDPAWARVYVAVEPGDVEVCHRNVRHGEQLRRIGADHGVSKSMASTRRRRVIRRLQQLGRDFFDGLTEETRARQAV